jgi:hypothetical protein
VCVCMRTTFWYLLSSLKMTLFFCFKESKIIKYCHFFHPCGNWTCNFSLPPHIMRNHVLAICPMQLKNVFAINFNCELVAKDTNFHNDKLMHLHANIQEISIKWCLVLCSFSSSLGHVIPNLKVYLKSLKLQPKAQK